MRPETAWRIIAVTFAAVVGIALLWPAFSPDGTFTTLFIKGGALNSEIPPAFSGNRAAYGFALFSLFSVSALSARTVITQICALRYQPLREYPETGLLRVAIIGLLLTILLGATPDVILLMAWGEVYSHQVELLMTIDRIGDGLTLAPFTAALLALIRGEQVTTELPPIPPRIIYRLVPTSSNIADHVKIVLSVLIIAGSLAILK